MPNPSSNPVVVQTASVINSSYTGVTYLIVGDITGDVTFGANCSLIFQGGKFVSGNMTGNCTSIDAPLNVIFGANVTIAGTWRVPTAYPEWFEAESATVPLVSGGTETVADDATRINKAFRLLMPPTGVARLQDIGGTLKLSGKYNIFSTIVVPRHVYLVGTNGYLSQIRLPDPTIYRTKEPETDPTDPPRGLFVNTVVRTDTQETFYVEAAIYYQNSTVNGTYQNKATGGRDFSVYLGLNPCHGLYVEMAYDQVVWENVEVYGTDASHHAFHFTTNNESVSHLGQTLLLMNCIGYRGTSYSNPETDVTPVFYFFRCNETNIIGCKAFANKEKINGIPGGCGFQFNNCRGVVMDGCSVTLAHTAVLITASSHTAAGYTVMGVTCEEISTYDVVARGNSSYTIASLTLLPVRHEGSGGNIIT